MRTARGRKRDASRDEAILEATIDILVEVGFDRMTVDMVAERAKAGKGAVYRRWPSKAQLVLDAVAQMKLNLVDLENLTDTGSLRGDLLALFRPHSAAEKERRMRAMAGLSAMLAQQPRLSDEGHAAVLEPWIEANRILIRRAIARGEVASTVDVEVVAQVIPSMAGYRSLVQRKPFELDFLIALLDVVLLPALGISITETAKPIAKPKRA